jgi:hypothetical protein
VDFRYIFPDSLRNRITAQWGIDVSDWWLPNDESRPPVVRLIREFIAERAKMKMDDKSTNLREMRGIFSTMSLSEASSPESYSPASSSNLRTTSEKKSPANDDAAVLPLQDSPGMTWTTMEGPSQ